MPLSSMIFTVAEEVGASGALSLEIQVALG